MTVEPTDILSLIVRRVHPLAKRLKLRIIQGRVLLTIPPYATPDDIERFLKLSQPWLQQHWMRFTEQPKPAAGCADDFLIQSNSLSVKMLKKDFSLKISELKKAVAVSKENVIYLPTSQPAKALTAWVLIQSKQALPERLDKLAKQHGFIYQHCKVRHAKTRWGSCNQQGSISLNAGLALLDEATMDYVLLHELCHTQHMNHSVQFWAAVAIVCPTYQTQQKQLRQFHWPVWWTY